MNRQTKGFIFGLIILAIIGVVVALAVKVWAPAKKTEAPVEPTASYVMPVGPAANEVTYNIVG